MLEKKSRKERLKIVATIGILLIGIAVVLSPISVQADGDAADGLTLETVAFDEETSIKDGLRMLGRLYMKNIIPSPNVEGVITVGKLYNVTFEEALQAVIGPNRYEIKENSVWVYTPEEYVADRNRMHHEVIPLYYITAAEAKKLVAPVLSEYGSVTPTTAAAVDTEPGEGGDSLAIQDKIVVVDYPDKLIEAKDLIESVDVQPPQVLIEVTILDAVLNETTQFGIDFDVMGLSTAVPGTVALGDDAISVGGFADSVTPAETGLSIGIVQGQVRAFIRALEGITNTTVLANPKILALNKQAGKVLIGNENGYLTTSQVSADGRIQEVSFLESGTKLEFRPFICKDGLIRMEIFPEQSIGSVDDDGLPNKSTTQVKTNVMVRDGKTIVLGGLFKEKTTQTRSQVPLFGDLPLIGFLFRSINDESIRTELIILITPHIISQPEQTKGTQDLEDVKIIANKARKDITWISRAKIAEERYTKAVRHYTEGNYEAALETLDTIYRTDRTFLEAEKLREKILRETRPKDFENLERIMRDRVMQQEADKWFRR